MILCLETATRICSVALCDEAGIISLRESDDLKSHASQLTVYIEEILKENSLNASQLDAIAVSKGPGSYTGLRIGVSVAKGIAFGASIPLIGIDTTFSMFSGLRQGTYGSRADENTLFCPMLDARRMEVYYALYDFHGNTIKDISAQIINEESFDQILANQRIIFFGDGAAKCREVVIHKNAIFADDFRISASFMQKPVIQAYNNKKFEDVAYFEPLYLKDFITSVPRKNIFGK